MEAANGIQSLATRNKGIGTLNPKKSKIKKSGQISEGLPAKLSGNAEGGHDAMIGRRQFALGGTAQMAGTRPRDSWNRPMLISFHFFFLAGRCSLIRRRRPRYDIDRAMSGCRGRCYPELTPAGEISVYVGSWHHSATDQGTKTVWRQEVAKPGRANGRR
ncbi:hypothetical protein V8C35DRAFT_286856 [Trichoderma chlorosporum]